MVNIITDLYTIDHDTDNELKNLLFKQVYELAHSIPDNSNKLRIVIGIKEIDKYR